MCNLLDGYFHKVMVEVDWSAIGNLFVGIGTIWLAVCARRGLESWKAQEFTKIQSDFLDDLINVFHESLGLISSSIGQLAILEDHISEIVVKTNNDKEVVKAFVINSELLYLNSLKQNYDKYSPVLTKLRALQAKGTTFNFKNYEIAQSAIDKIGRVSENIAAYILFLGLKTELSRNDLIDVLKRGIKAKELKISWEAASKEMLEFASKELQTLWSKY